MSLYVRPPRPSAERGTYVELLGRGLGSRHRVVNLARVSYDLHDAVSRFTEDLLPLAPEIVIVHLGVNESVSRFLPRWLWRFAYGGRERITRPDPFRRAIVLLDSLLRGWVTRIAPRGWFSEVAFERLTMDLLGQLGKEFAARVVVVGITNPSDRVERQLRGSQDRVRRFDAILERCATRCGATFIPVRGVGDAAAMYPDGIHFSADGHQWLAERLLAHLR